jgi:hypothetical protein
MCKFESVAVVVLARNEVNSLRETVETLLRLCPAEDLEQVILFLAPNATPECRAVADELERSSTEVPVRVVIQKKNVGIRETQDVFEEQSRASHAMFMVADLEVPIEKFAEMAAQCKAHPDALVAFSRWMPGGGFTGYPKWQLPLHYIFQQTVRILYHGCGVTDATAGYTAMPREVFVSQNLRENHHGVFLEYKLIPMRLGLPLVEIPLQWHIRREGKSTNSFFRKLSYFVPLFKVWLTPQNKLLREGGESDA